MLIDLKSAKYCENYKIELEFKDGKNGVVDFSFYKRKGGIFKKFEDINYFKSFKIDKELGILSWNNEIDIAPESLYCQATKSPLPA